MLSLNIHKVKKFSIYPHLISLGEKREVVVTRITIQTTEDEIQITLYHVNEEKKEEKNHEI